jgi:signal transduction histidine kinase
MPSVHFPAIKCGSMVRFLGPRQWRSLSTGSAGGRAGGLRHQCTCIERLRWLAIAGARSTALFKRVGIVVAPTRKASAVVASGGARARADRLPRHADVERSFGVEERPRATGLDALATDFATASGDIFWDSDERHVCTWTSANFRSWRGDRVGRAIGQRLRNCRLLDGAGDPFIPERKLEDLLERQAEFKTVCALGSGDWGRLFLLCGLPRRGGSGEFAGYRGIARDVTAQVSAERAARSMAQAVLKDERKTQFVGQVSHELRTPLNAVLGIGQLLIRKYPGPDSCEDARWIGLMLSAAQRMLQLVNGLLDIARMESGRMALAQEDFCIEEALCASVALVHACHCGSTLRLEIPPASSRHTVHADRQGVEQILINLLSNALKYSGTDGAVTVTIAGGEQVSVAIQDNGIGIAPSTMKDLFQPFNRLGAEKTVVPGIGLGLAISQSLAQAMSGSIVIESLQGVGTRSTLNLRAGSAAVDPI